MSCFLAQFSSKPCDGRLVRAHLIPKQLLRREFPGMAPHLELDPRSYVLACGGIMGNSGHHGMLDASRTLRIPRNCLPAGLEEFAAELGLSWWLDREYGATQ